MLQLLVIMMLFKLLTRRLMIMLRVLWIWGVLRPLT